MTSGSFALQCGQRGSERGWFRGGRRVLLLLQTTKHAESVRVDGALAAAPAHSVPLLPVDVGVGRLRLQLLFQTGSQLARSHAQLALAMQSRCVAIRRPEPFDGLLPRAVQWRAVDAGTEPAA